MYVKFKVEVSEHQYSYEGKSETAEVKIQVPRDVLDNIDPGNILVGALKSALEKFDAAPEEEAA